MVNEITYPFECRICGKEVKKTRGRKNAKSHRKGKCTNKCDGIIRDSGGFPIDPFLRAKYKAALQVRSKFKRMLNNLASSNTFYDSDAWRQLRYKVLKQQGRTCIFCKSTNGPFHVDHIKPRSKYPHLELDINNLQVLCADCNLGKSNLDETDWREKQA